MAHHSAEAAPDASDSPKRSATADYRSEARQLAMQFLHQLHVQGEAGLGGLAEFLNEYSDNCQTRQLAKAWIEGAWSTHDAADKMIQSVSSNWDLSRLNQVDLSNLRLAVHQLTSCPDVPAKVVINEAIELARRFGSAGSVGFVNGVLDAVYRQLTQQQQPES